LGLGRRELEHPGTLTVDSFRISKRQFYAFNFSIIFIGDNSDISLGRRIKRPDEIYALIREVRTPREIDVGCYQIALGS
jgi:hypothetical protein